jgi:phosphoribosylanthranilate isomerase
MAVSAKICGLKTPEDIAAAIKGGADFVGFNFFATSPRSLTAEEAGLLGRMVPAAVKKVGLLVDDSDERIEAILKVCPLDMLQLHGDEAPERVAAIKQRFGIAAMKVLKIRTAADIDRAAIYEPVADWLMFDTLPPAGMKNALPGGNAVSFDWSLLTGRRFRLPWMLAGGLTPENLAEAVRISGARTVDVSSGVEDRPGVKNPSKIKVFLDVVRSL